jgi:hypothetical protein
VGSLYRDLRTNQFGTYLARFSLVHVISYALVGGAALFLQRYLSPADVFALDFFAPYQIAPGPILLEAIRALVLGVIFLPFFRIAKESRWGAWVLFAPLWGLTIIGSIDTWVGSIEGVIYTETTAAAHLFFLLASAVQYGLVVSVLLWSERRRPSLPRIQRPDGSGRPTPGSAPFWGYLSRFTLVYVAAYLTAGIAFFILHDYGTVIPDSAAFALWRPMDHPFIQLAILFQFARGAFLGLLLFPVYGWVFSSSRGWLLVFFVMWGGTYLGTPATVRNLVGDVLSPGPLTDMLFGTAEITVQMLGFALVFWFWQRRATRRTGLVARIIGTVSG